MAFPLDELASAYERREALQKHLQDHCDHYNYALFMALPPDEQTRWIVDTSGDQLRVGMFEPRVVACDGKYLAVPLTTYGQSGVQAFVDFIGAQLEKALARPKEILQSDWNDTVIVPTPGLTISSRLGSCSTCEDYVKQTRDLEIRRLSARAALDELEVALREQVLSGKLSSDVLGVAIWSRVQTETRFETSRRRARQMRS